MEAVGGEDLGKALEEFRGQRGAARKLQETAHISSISFQRVTRGPALEGEGREERNRVVFEGRGHFVLNLGRNPVIKFSTIS